MNSPAPVTTTSQSVQTHPPTCECQSRLDQAFDLIAKLQSDQTTLLQDHSSQRTSTEADRTEIRKLQTQISSLDSSDQVQSVQSKVDSLEESLNQHKTITMETQERYSKRLSNFNLIIGRTGNTIGSLVESVSNNTADVEKNTNVS